MKIKSNNFFKKKSENHRSSLLIDNKFKVLGLIQSVEVAMLRLCMDKTSSIAVDGNGIFSCEHIIGKCMSTLLEFHSAWVPSDTYRQYWQQKTRN